MRCSKTCMLALVLSLAERSISHVRMSHLIVNGTVTPEWYYVRDVSEDPVQLLGPEPPRYPKRWPQFPFNMSHPNFRCGRDAWMPKPNGTERLTRTADVLAGSEVGFELGDFEDPYEPRIFHKGPGQIYLAKAPDTIPLSEWDGDGDWFKIAYAGPLGYQDWDLFIEDRRRPPISWNFTIPKTTPPGRYLMRIEHIYPHEKNETQLWANCAQINIIGDGGGKPTQFARFPGTYQMDHPGIRLPDGTKIPGTEYWDNTNYTAPGPPVWEG